MLVERYVVEGIEQGFSLEEAFRRFITEAERTELDKYENYRHPLPFGSDGPPTQYEIFHDKYEKLRTPLQENFMQKLRSGELTLLLH
jgi:hypothetical protein